MVAATTGQSPYERWYGKAPDVSKFRVFGCIAYAHIPEADRRKLDKKAARHQLLGYSETQKGYRLLDMQQSNKVIVRVVICNKLHFGNQKESVEIIEEKDINAQGSLDGQGVSKPAERDSSKDEAVSLRRSQRSTKGVPPA